MAQSKRKLDDLEYDGSVNDRDGTSTIQDRPRYLPGKQPRNSESLPTVDYKVPMEPKSELYTEQWSIPRFNLFVSYTLDNLIEAFKPMFKDFIKLPSRKFHPQYYYKVNQPISINEIKSRDYEYPGGTRTFLLDVELITKNCTSYNDEESLIAKNSMQVVQYIKKEVLRAKNIKKNYLLNQDVKTRLMTYVDRLINVTEKDLELTLGNRSAAETGNDKLKIVEPFMELVDKTHYPDYYEVIYTPIALSGVKENLETDHYTKIYDLILDVHTVFHNALVFNHESTLIHQDASKLLLYFNHIIQNEFFPELQDGSERGEIQLEYDKSEYAQYMNNNSDSGTVGLLDDSQLTDYDFGQFEGLGNGYNRTLLSEDYLLGPTKKDGTANNSTKAYRASEEEADVNQMKYNIFKSLARDITSQVHAIQMKPYELINSFKLYSTEQDYGALVNPTVGMKPQCSQELIEFIFEGYQQNQNENAFSISLPQTQNNLLVAVDLNVDTQINTLNLNREPVALDKAKEVTGSAEKSVAKNGNLIKYHIKLAEGLNFLEFRTSRSMDDNDSEIMKFWITLNA